MAVIMPIALCVHFNIMDDTSEALWTWILTELNVNQIICLLSVCLELKPKKEREKGLLIHRSTLLDG